MKKSSIWLMSVFMMLLLANLTTSSLQAGWNKALERHADFEELANLCSSGLERTSSKPLETSAEDTEEQLVQSAIRVSKHDQWERRLEALKLCNPLEGDKLMEDQYLSLRDKAAVSSSSQSSRSLGGGEEFPEDSHGISPISHKSPELLWEEYKSSHIVGLRKEAYQYINDEYVKKNKLPSQSSRPMEDIGGWPAAMSNLWMVIEQNPLPPIGQWLLRGWVKKYNKYLFELLPKTIDGPLKEKFIQNPPSFL